MSKGVSSRLSRCIRWPIRALSRARDLYVRSMTFCAKKSGTSVGYPTMAQWARSGEDDLRELIRAASRGRSGPPSRVAKVDGGGVIVWRTQSVVVGRIDEDHPCEFHGDVGVGSSLLFPRSRSCSVAVKKAEAEAEAGPGARARARTPWSACA